MSPNGIGTEAFWGATHKGVSGVGPITRFDTSGLAVRVAGEVKDFREEDYVTAKDRPHVSRAVPLPLGLMTPIPVMTTRRDIKGVWPASRSGRNPQGTLLV